jgi:hypothetical protein
LSGYGEKNEKPKVSLERLAETWFEQKAAQGTTDKQRNMMLGQKTMMIDFFNSQGFKTVADLKPDTAHKFLTWRSVTNYTSSRKAKISASTLKHNLQVFKQMAKVAVRNDWIVRGDIWDDVHVKSIVGVNRIVEQEQGGKARAEYGKGLLNELSVYLTERLGRGFSIVNLKSFRKFYITYAPSIGQTLTAQFNFSQKGQTVSAELPFRLSWSHYQILMRIENSNERHFYEVQAANEQWTVRQLQRQYGSSLYERLALSRNKDEVMRLAKEGQTIEKPRDMLKNPLVFEFLNMAEDSAYSETDLETAIIALPRKE